MTMVPKFLRCLRHSYQAARSLFPRQCTQTCPLTIMFQACRDTSSMSKVWKTRLGLALGNFVEFGWVVVVYLASELVIWGLSRALAPVHLEFFSSIFGMVLIFTLMTVAYLFSDSVDYVYRCHIKSKVDFINTHIGVGFPVPLIMLNQSDILGGREIASIIGNFIITNLTFWTLVFSVSLLVMTIASVLTSNASDDLCPPRPMTATPPRVEINWLSDSTLDQPTSLSGPHTSKRPGCMSPCQESDRSQIASRRSSIDVDPERSPCLSPVWNFFVSHFPLLASFLAIFVIGAPIAAATQEERILDGAVLWFIWALTIWSQRKFKSCGVCSSTPKIKDALVTLMNPVLLTTLLMTAYTRGKAEAYGPHSLSRILSIFSSGTSLYALWTSLVTNTSLTYNSSAWFGAGDAALSILECGILTWGFKLYECRRQLFSVAGLLAAIVAVAVATANVFLSVLVGRTLGMRPPEALAFAARSTTLALAKPAMEAVGGNLGANAALVVSNGIFGQLCYPSLLKKLRVKEEGDDNIHNADECQETKGRFSSMRRAAQRVLANGDDPVTIAVGVTIGINAAAMGVSYLYETRSRAAPYAALAMTISGIMTVVLTTVEPFRSVVVNLAG